MMEIRLKSTFLELLFVCLCLLTVFGPANGETVRVTEGSEAVLPCFIRPERDITQDVFDWKKDGQKKVFFYEKGKHYNNDLPGQDELFRGRVFHFPDQLQFGDASIRITDTKPSDTGTYSCDYSPDEPSRQTFYIELVVVSAVVRVEEGSEAVLPCFIRPERNITQDVFDWKKDDLKEVFFYEKGSHYNNGREGQDEQFKGRVSHFPDQLQFSNASIRITDTKWSDRGNYSCDFSPDDPSRQTFNIELVVDCILKDRSKENIPDACPKPHLVSHDQSKHMSMLKCKVQGASPKPKVELKDSSGDTLHAVETLVPKTGGSYDIILQTNVTKTDTYHCVVTQEEICHQVSEEIPVYLPGAATEPSVTIIDFKTDSALLQCVVKGASPKPKVKWQDSSGNILPAEEPQVTERGGSYDIILQATVTETGTYQCVVTPEEMKHQTKAEIQVHINGFSAGHVFSAVGGGGVVLVAWLCYTFYKSRNSKKGPQTETGDKEKNPNESVPMKSDPSEPQ